MKKVLPEQTVTSFTPEANAYRNIHRPIVDKLFLIKSRSKGNLKKKLDFKARQLWRTIIIHANKL
jgi:hypothetical protein